MTTFAKMIDPTHKRMARMLGYCLTLESSEGWQGFTALACAKLTERARVCLAWATLNSLDQDKAAAVAESVLGCAGYPRQSAGRGATEPLRSSRGGNPAAPVFDYASGESVGQVWGNVIKRAKIARLSPHSCRHGFATAMLRAGIDPKTVAKMGGWKDVATVMKHYAHAMDDPTVTDAIFDTPLTQGRMVRHVNASHKRRK